LHGRNACARKPDFVMDAARQRAIAACGRCGQPEDAHKLGAGASREDLALFAALGGACPDFVASDASLIYAKHLAIASRAPVRQPGRVGKRAPLCARCGHRGHQPKDCPL
jgi:hypothetical protein